MKATSETGDWGTPGSSYRLFKCSVERLKEDLFELKFKDESGSHQGYREPHREQTFRVRACNTRDVEYAALIELDAAELKCNVDARQAIREACYDMDDMLEAEANAETQ